MMLNFIKNYDLGKEQQNTLLRFNYIKKKEFGEFKDMHIDYFPLI